MTDGFEMKVEPNAIELSDAQETVLDELLSIHRNRGDGAVKGKEIASGLGQNPGTIRTQMQSLKSLTLVKGIPGPNGGYEPTARAYEIADVERSEERSQVPIRKNGKRIDEISVTEIDFISLQHPDQREAEVQFQGSHRRLSVGDEITIGPTPSVDLLVTGTVTGLESSENVCIVQIDSVEIESTVDRSANSRVVSSGSNTPQ